MYEVSAFVAVLEGTLALEPHRENKHIGICMRRLFIDSETQAASWEEKSMDFCEQTDSANNFRLATIQIATKPRTNSCSRKHQSFCTYAHNHAHMHTHKRRQIQTFSSSQRLPMSPILCGNLTGECRTVTKDSSLFAL